MLSAAANQIGKLLASKTSREAAPAALKGAGLNAILGGVIGGPKAAVGYAAGDFLLNYPLVGLARKYFPGSNVSITNAAGKTTKQYMPSKVEQGVNLGASLVSAPVTDIVTGGALLPTPQVMPTNMSQEQQEYAQLVQRQQLNDLQTQALSPGTMYQMQGLEHTAFHYPGITLPPEILQQLQEAA